MEKRIPLLVIALLAILLLFLLLFQLPEPETPSQGDTVVFRTSSGDIEVSVEIADTPEKRGEGLMYRESLPENSGMLFIFEDEAIRTFWMKNTHLPLDMIFINSEMDIVHIEKDAQPCESDPCRTYSSQLPAKYVVEVNAGFSERKGLDIGDFVEFSHPWTVIPGPH
jgi:uncharacterized membrane protein (UPF0127 family)